MPDIKPISDEEIRGHVERRHIDSWPKDDWVRGVLARVESDALTISELEEKVERLEKRCQPEWFYPEGETESEYCESGESEVIDNHFDNNPDDKGCFVLGISQATSLPDVFASVTVLSDEDRLRLGVRDDYTYELHDTREEAETALLSPPTNVSGEQS